ncbi:hypothetical protein V1477_020806 [Vespula maculifrons]|uniref:Uncharacterized protein n=1 Tax=Vespula maculifrons TaxID=7453 RepID=A0ABD2ANI4_VESMC
MIRSIRISSNIPEVHRPSMGLKSQQERREEEDQEENEEEKEKGEARGAMLRARLTRCRTLQDESLSSSPATRESTFYLNASYRGLSTKNVDQLIISSGKSGLRAFNE